MGAISDNIEEMKRRRAEEQRGRSLFERQWSNIERIDRVLGLGLGAVGSVLKAPDTPFGLPAGPRLPISAPDPSTIPAGAQAFWDLAREGDVDAAVTAAHQAMPAEGSYWGLMEGLGGAFLPTGAPAAIGKGLIRGAPRLAGTLSSLAPAATREATKRGLISGITDVGKGLRLPWEAEEAFGKAATGAVVGAVKAPFNIFRGLRTDLLTDVDTAVRAGQRDMADELVGEAVEETPLSVETPLTVEAPAPSPTLIPLAVDAPPSTGMQSGMGIGERPSQGELLPEFVGEGGAVDLADREALLAAQRQREAVASGQQVLPETAAVEYDDFEVRLLEDELVEASSRWSMLKDELRDFRAGSWESGVVRPPKMPGVRNPRRSTGSKIVYDSWDIDRLRGRPQERKVYDLSKWSERKLMGLAQENDLNPYIDDWWSSVDPEIARSFDGMWNPEVSDRNIKSISDDILKVEDEIKALEAQYNELIKAQPASLADEGFVEDVLQIDEGLGGPPPGDLPPVDVSIGDVSPGKAPRFRLDDPRSMKETVDLAITPHVWDRLARTPALGWIMKNLNPAAVANKPELKGLVARAMLMSEGQQKTQVAMARLMRLGTFSDLFGKIDPQTGLIAEGPISQPGVVKRFTGKMLGIEQAPLQDNPFAGMAPNDLRTYWRRWKKEGQFSLPLDKKAGQKVPITGEFKLTDQQAEWLNTASELERAKRDFLKRNGIDFKLLSFERGGEYAGRRVFAKVDRDGKILKSVTFKDNSSQGFIGSQLSSSKERAFKGSQAEALREGYRYLPEEETLAINLQAAYNSVADRKFGNWLLDELPAGKGLMEADPRLSLRKFAKNEKGKWGFDDEAARKLGPFFSRAGFEGDEAKQALDMLKKELAPGPAGGFTTALQAVNKANAVARFFTLAGDVSPFMIQLLYTVGTNPVAFGKAMRGFGEAFMDPNFHDKYIAKHADTLNLHDSLISTRQGSEFTEAVDRGGWLAEVADRPGPMGGVVQGFNVYRGGLAMFQRGFNAALDVAGVEMAEGLEHLARAADGSFDRAKLKEIDGFVNEIRGLASSARLGVSPSMRELETFLMLAPRYNRAIAALLWDTARGIAGTGRDQSLRTKLARDGMGKAVAGLSALNVAITTAHYTANTDRDKWSMEGWRDAIEDHLVPTSSNFFTWDVLGRNIGPGTKVRSVLQLLARSAIDPMDLTKGFGMENPLVRFLRGSSAPAISKGVDLLSGYNYIGEPTRGEVGSLRDGNAVLPKIVAPNFFPIWAQAVILEGGTPQERLLGGVAEFFGGRGYPLTRTQELQKYHKQDPLNKDTPWDELGGDVLAEYDIQFTEETGDPGHRGKRGRIKEKIDNLKVDHYARIAEVAEDYLSDDPLSTSHQPQKAKDAIAKSKEQIGAELHGPYGLYEQLYGRGDFKEPTDKESLQYVKWKYYDMYDNAPKNEDGDIDWDEFEPMQQKFWAGLSQKKANWLLDSIHLTEQRYHPKAKQLLEATRWVANVKAEVDGVDIGLWDINKHPKVIATLAHFVPELTAEEIEDYMDQDRNVREGLELRQERYRKLADLKGSMEAAPNRRNGYRGGMIYQYKKEFVADTPPGWLNTMLMYDFNFPGDNDIRERYKKLRDEIGPEAFVAKFRLPNYREEYQAMKLAQAIPDVEPVAVGAQ